jgi:DNA-3-methyladenine glycosylase II
MPPPKVANISKKRKAQSKGGVSDAAPSTPKRKKPSRPVPPITPTPSAIGLMTVPYSSGDIDDSTPPPLNRLAVPNCTNAPLVTPETHRVIANKAVDQFSPSKRANIKTTTGNLLEEALAHLVKVEPRLKPVVEKHHCHVFSPEGLAEEIDPFNSLASGIISQQVRHVGLVLRLC